MNGQNFDILRQRMVREQLLPRGIVEEKVLSVFRKVPRHEFVPESEAGSAYGDYPLPIGEGQTISQPYMVAAMTELLDLKKSDKVLEIGTGSGYQAAVLAELAGEVYSVERVQPLADRARENLKKLGCANVKIKVGDGTLGWGENAPYDAIVVTAGSPEVPKALIEQLSEGGRLAIPVGGRYSQMLTKVQKLKSKIKATDVCGCVFVPLIGRQGWDK